MTEYDVGSNVRVTGTFRNSSGTATDPTTVTFKYLTPAGVSTTLVYGTDGALVKSGIGEYYVDVSLTASGSWRVRFESTGTAQAASEETLVAKYTSF